MQQRPIKFRAWDTELGAMLTANIVNGGLVFIREDRLIRRDWDSPNLVLEQFSGLLDKKDVEIYEGDVVRIPAWNHNEQRIALAQFKAGSFVVSFGPTDLPLSPTSKALHGYEVVGNIHENPELLTN